MATGGPADLTPAPFLGDLPPTMTVQQAGQMLGVCRRTAYRAAERGQIPTIRIGRRLFVPTAKLLTMLGLDEPADPRFLSAAPGDTATYELPNYDVPTDVVYVSEPTP